MIQRQNLVVLYKGGHIRSLNFYRGRPLAQKGNTIANNIVNLSIKRQPHKMVKHT